MVAKFNLETVSRTCLFLIVILKIEVGHPNLGIRFENQVVIYSVFKHLDLNVF